jgi:uncharacterized protein GlcG (DUF336 family)
MGVSESAVHTLSLSHASTIVDEALATAHSMKFQPMSVAVLDAGGHLVAFKREDHSGIMRFEVAFGKAWGALGMGRPSRGFEQLATQRCARTGTLRRASRVPDRHEEPEPCVPEEIRRECGTEVDADGRR